MSEVLVIGHRQPDTDAICSAIGYAEFKRLTGLPQAVAARCGDSNDRIDFVLHRFQTALPRFVADVSPKVRDVMQSDVQSVPPSATVADSLTLMESRHLRVLPVLSSERTCLGLISLYKMSRFLFPTPNRLLDSRQVFATMRNLARTLQGELIRGSELDREEDLLLMVGAMKLDSFIERLARFPRSKLVVIVGNREDIQQAAVAARVRAVVVTGGLPIDPAVIESAGHHEVTLISSPHDSATTALLARASMTVTRMLHDEFLTFREEDSVAYARSIAATSDFHAFPVLDPEKRCAGILTKSDFLKRIDRKLILVDHNELSQAVPGADQVEILEIIDHHRIGLTTTHPILFRNVPVGSTSTIVADCFMAAGLEISENIAGLLLAGLISDTLNLTSPTTTEKDAQILRRLEQRAGVNAAEFTEKLFASGSVLISKPARAAIQVDSKEYRERSWFFSVGQIEEIDFTHFWRRKGEVTAALDEYRTAKGYSFSALLITDVVKQTSLLLLAASADILRLVDYPELEPGIYELQSVVSRKKQLLPYLSHLLNASEQA